MEFAWDYDATYHSESPVGIPLTMIGQASRSAGQTGSANSSSELRLCFVFLFFFEPGCCEGFGVDVVVGVEFGLQHWRPVDQLHPFEEQVGGVVLVGLLRGTQQPCPEW